MWYVGAVRWGKNFNDKLIPKPFWYDTDCSGRTDRQTPFGSKYRADASHREAKTGYVNESSPIQQEDARPDGRYDMCTIDQW